MAFTKEQMAENIKRFEELLGSVHREIAGFYPQE